MALGVKQRRAPAAIQNGAQNGYLPDICRPVQRRPSVLVYTRNLRAKDRERNETDIR